MHTMNLFDWCVRNGLLSKDQSVTNTNISTLRELVKKSISAEYLLKIKTQDTICHIVTDVLEADKQWLDFVNKKHETYIKRYKRNKVASSMTQQKKVEIVDAEVLTDTTVDSTTNLVEWEDAPAFLFFQTNIASYMVLENNTCFPEKLTIIDLYEQTIYRKSLNSFVIGLKKNPFTQNDFKNLVLKSNLTIFLEFLDLSISEKATERFTFLTRKIYFIAFKVCAFKAFLIEELTTAKNNQNSSLNLIQTTENIITNQEIKYITLKTLSLFLWVEDFRFAVSNIFVLLSTKDPTFPILFQQVLVDIFNAYSISYTTAESRRIGLAAFFYIKGSLINLCWLLLRVYNPTLLQTTLIHVKTLIKNIISYTYKKSTYRYLFALLSPITIKNNKFNFTNLTTLEKKALNLHIFIAENVKASPNTVNPLFTNNTTQKTYALQTNKKKPFNAFSSAISLPVKKKWFSPKPRFLSLRCYASTDSAGDSAKISITKKIPVPFDDAIIIISTLHLTTNGEKTKTGIAINALMFSIETKRYSAEPVTEIVTEIVTLSTQVQKETVKPPHGLMFIKSFTDVYIEKDKKIHKQPLNAYFNNFSKTKSIILVELLEKTPHNSKQALIAYFAPSDYSVKKRISFFETVVQTILEILLIEVLANKDLYYSSLEITNLEKTALCQMLKNEISVSITKERKLIAEACAEDFIAALKTAPVLNLIKKEILPKTMKKRDASVRADQKQKYFHFIENEKLHPFVKAVRNYLNFFIINQAMGSQNAVIVAPAIYNGVKAFDSAALYTSPDCLLGENPESSCLLEEDPVVRYADKPTLQENLANFLKVKLAPNAINNVLMSLSGSNLLPEIWVYTGGKIVENFINNWVVDLFQDTQFNLEWLRKSSNNPSKLERRLLLKMLDNCFQNLSFIYGNLCNMKEVFVLDKFTPSLHTTPVETNFEKYTKKLEENLVYFPTFLLLLYSLQLSLLYTVVCFVVLKALYLNTWDSEFLHTGFKNLLSNMCVNVSSDRTDLKATSYKDFYPVDISSLDETSLLTDKSQAFDTLASQRLSLLQFEIQKLNLELLTTFAVVKNVLSLAIAKSKTTKEKSYYKDVLDKYNNFLTLFLNLTNFFTNTEDLSGFVKDMLNEPSLLTKKDFDNRKSFDHNLEASNLTKLLPLLASSSKNFFLHKKLKNAEGLNQLESFVNLTISISNNNVFQPERLALKQMLHNCLNKTATPSTGKPPKLFQQNKLPKLERFVTKEIKSSLINLANTLLTKSNMLMLPSLITYTSVTSGSSIFRKQLADNIAVNMRNPSKPFFHVLREALLKLKNINPALGEKLITVFDATWGLDLSGSYYLKLTPDPLLEDSEEASIDASFESAIDHIVEASTDASFEEL